MPADGGQVRDRQQPAVFQRIPSSTAGSERRARCWTSRGSLRPIFPGEQLWHHRRVTLCSESPWSVRRRTQGTQSFAARRWESLLSHSYIPMSWLPDRNKPAPVGLYNHQRSRQEHRLFHKVQQAGQTRRVRFHRGARRPEPVMEESVLRYAACLRRARQRAWTVQHRPQFYRGKPSSGKSSRQFLQVFRGEISGLNRGVRCRLPHGKITYGQSWYPRRNSTGQTSDSQASGAISPSFSGDEMLAVSVRCKVFPASDTNRVSPTGKIERCDDFARRSVRRDEPPLAVIFRMPKVAESTLLRSCGGDSKPCWDCCRFADV